MSNEQPVKTTTRVVAPLFGDEPSQPLAPVAASPASMPTVQATQVRTVAPVVSEEDIANLGKGTEQALTVISDRLLSAQRAGDSGDLGSNLNKLIGEAKGLDPATLGKKSLLGKAIGKVLGVKENLMGQFDTVKGRINALMVQMDREVAVQAQRVHDLDDLYAANYDYHQRLETAKNEGERLLAGLDAQIQAATDSAGSDSFAANALADLQDRRTVLEKRIDDFGRAMLLSKQTAPSIQQMKQNARQLVQTFNDLKSTTLPIWQNVFSQYLISLDQQRGARLATNVSDATNEAIRRNAELLGQNTKEIAEARQRPVIDLKTLQDNQAALFATLDAVALAEENGRKARAEAAPQLAALEKGLIARFAPGGARPALGQG
jgi:uncharacterized protein YaaN involved in tellurite resistance